MGQLHVCRLKNLNKLTDTHYEVVLTSPPLQLTAGQIRALEQNNVKVLDEQFVYRQSSPQVLESIVDQLNVCQSMYDCGSMLPFTL